MDLKNDGYYIFTDAFLDDINEIEKLDAQDRNIVKFTKFTTSLSNKLSKTKEFDAEEQWFILLNLYLSLCESIKSLHLKYIRDVYDNLSDKSGYRIGNFVTLYPFVETMRRYKNGKYVKLFESINVDLRNSIAHLDYYFEDGNNNIYYKATHIEGTDFILNYRKIAILFAILYIDRSKVFANEYEQKAKDHGLI